MEPRATTEAVVAQFHPLIDPLAFNAPFTFYANFNLFSFSYTVSKSTDLSLSWSRGSVAEQDTLQSAHPWYQTLNTCKYLTLYLNTDVKKKNPCFQFFFFFFLSSSSWKCVKIELYLSSLSAYTVASIDSIMYIGHLLVLFHIEK